MVKSCAALNCRNRWTKESKITFLKFPFSKPELLKRWLVELQRENFVPNRNTYICSEHFKETDFLKGYINSRRLVDNAVPSIFNSTKRLRKSSSKKIQRKNSRKKQPKSIQKKLGSKYDVTNETEEVISEEMVPEQENERISIHDDEIMMEKENETGEKLEETTLSTPLCRLCASPSEDAISIFENKQSDGVLLEKIHTYLPIMISAEDLLPTTVCGKCIDRLEICHSLVQDCLDADVTLKTMFGLQNSNQVQNSNKNAVGKRSDSSCHTKNAFNNSLEKRNQCEDFMNLTDVKFEVESNDDVGTETTNQSAVETNDIVETETANQNGAESSGIVEAEMSNQNAVESNDIMEAGTSNRIAVEKNNIQNNDAIQNSNKVNKSRKRKRKPKLKFLVVKKKAEKNVSEEAELQKILEFALRKMNPKKSKTQVPKERHKPQEMPSVDNCSVATHKEISRLKDTDQNVGHIHEEIAQDHTYTRKEHEESLDCEKT